VAVWAVVAVVDMVMGLVTLLLPAVVAVVMSVEALLISWSFVKKQKNNRKALIRSLIA